MSRFTIQIFDGQSAWKLNTSWKTISIWALSLCVLSCLSLYISYLNPAQYCQNKKTYSQNQLWKVKALLMNKKAEELSHAASFLNKQLETLSMFMNNTDTNVFYYNPDFRNVTVEKELIGFRILIYKVKIGDRVLFEYIADKFKPKQTQLVEERMEVFRNNISTLIEQANYNPAIEIVQIGPDDFSGCAAGLEVFNLNKDDMLAAQVDGKELAEKYCDTLNKELKIAKDNHLLLEYPLTGKVNTVSQFSFPGKIIKITKKNLNFAEEILADGHRKFEQINQQVILINSNFARTPSIYPLRYEEITSPFGYRIHPLSKKVTMHSGLDMVAWPGTKVKATADGVVTGAGFVGGYGLVVQINHGMGLSTLYGHCSQLMVRKGQRIRKGDLIALSGDTGLSAGPHLHYEIRKWNISIDPSPYLNRDVFTAQKGWSQ